MRSAFLATLFALAAVIAVTATTAEAAICTKRGDLLNTLTDKYRESSQAIGLISSRGVFEVFTSRSGSWTAFVTNPKGIACVLATGEHYEQLPRKTNDPDA